jgi:hypothetical protein
MSFCRVSDEGISGLADFENASNLSTHIYMKIGHTLVEFDLLVFFLPSRANAGRVGAGTTVVSHRATIETHPNRAGRPAFERNVPCIKLQASTEQHSLQCAGLSIQARPSSFLADIIDLGSSASSQC